MGHNEERTLANLPPGERILVDISRHWIEVMRDRSINYKSN